MVDYKPQFRPMYDFGGKSDINSKSLIGRITNYYVDLSNSISNSYFDSFKDKSWKEIGSDFKITTKNDFKKKTTNVKEVVNNVTTDISRGKIIYASVGIGVGLGLGGNYVGAHVANELGFNHTVIDYVSMGLEFLLHWAGYAGTFIFMSIAEGKTREEIKMDLTKSSICALPVAAAYPFIRIPFADILMTKDIPLIDIITNKSITPELANVLSQLTLMLPYGRGVKYSVTRNGPQIEEFLKEHVFTNYGKTEALSTTLRTDDAAENIHLDEIVEQDLIEKVS